MSILRLTSRALHLAVGCSVVMLAWAAWSAWRGLDLTDESFYLNWMEAPERYSPSTTLFGFVYHPLYVLVEGEIAALRVVNLAVMAALIAGSAVLHLRRSRFSAKHTWLLAAGVAGLSPLAFPNAILTPSYYSLAASGAATVLMGLCLVNSARRRTHVCGALVVGLGGTALFLAKPPTAAAVALLVLAHLLVHRHRTASTTAMSALFATTLVIAAAVIIDSSVPAFVRRLRDGAADARVLDAGHDLGSLLSIDPLSMGWGGAVLLLGLTAAGLAGLTALRSRRPFILALTAGAAALACAALVYVVPHLISPVRPSRWVFLLAPLTVAAAAAAVKRPALTREDTAWLLLLVGLPFALAFGSNVDNLLIAGTAGYCWLLAAIHLTSTSSSEAGARLAAATFLVVGTLIGSGVLAISAAAQPYRQTGPVWTFDTPTSVGGSSVVLSDDSAAWVARVRAKTAEFPPETPIIDLTGMSPGVIRVLGGVPLERPWVVGGYPGAAALERLSLQRTPCEEFAKAYLLIEHEGPRSLPSDVLGTLGATLDDYGPVASWHPMSTAAYPDRGTMHLMAPRRSQELARMVCADALGVG